MNTIIGTMAQWVSPMGFSIFLLLKHRKLNKSSKHNSDTKPNNFNYRLSERENRSWFQYICNQIDMLKFKVQKATSRSSAIYRKRQKKMKKLWSTRKMKRKKLRIIKIVLDYTLHTCGMWCLVFEYVVCNVYCCAAGEKEEKMNCTSDTGERRFWAL